MLVIQCIGHSSHAVTIQHSGVVISALHPILEHFEREVGCV